MPAFLFDLDGTLGDTLPFCIRAFREAIEPRSGRQLVDADIIATFGPSEEGMICTLLPGREQEGVDAYIERYAALHHECPDPFDGMREVLHYLRSQGAFVGLVTGKGARSTALTLAQYGLGDFFDTVKVGASSGPVKDVRIQEIFAEFELNRAETYYVGDAPADIRAARDCGIKMVAAAWASTADRALLASMEPDYLFTSVAAFDNFVRRVCGA